MATCNIKTTNKAYMVSVGALEEGSAKVKNERLFDVHNANIRDAANQRYNLKTEELPFSKAVRDIPRNARSASNYFIEWQFNDKFFDEVTPVVEMYKSMEDVSQNESITPNTSVTSIQNAIKNNLPSEVSNIVNVVETVPLDILGREDLFFSIKEILENNGITEPILINWIGINNQINPKSIKSTQQLLDIIKNRYDKKKNINNHIELKNNKLALESFNKWVKALEKYPIAFSELMLTHAIKYLNPQRRSKYVLQLSEAALTTSFGIVTNKPHELNRIGKLYDTEVLKTVSDAVGHEPSASGEGYWVHIPKIAQTSIAYQTNIVDNSNDPNAPGKFTVYYMSEIDQDNEVEFFETREAADLFVQSLGGMPGSDAQFKVNVELLRKLSPATWCTSGGMASHYVANYNNYILIVNGVTVAGIEAGNIGNNGKIQVKEVTSRGNNGVASVDHLDDIIAFFEKHNLDLDNRTIQNAINARDKGKTDNEIFKDIPDNAVDWEQTEEEYWEERNAIDRHNGEFEYDGFDYAERDYDERLQQQQDLLNEGLADEAAKAQALTSIEATLDYIENSEYKLFSEIPVNLMADEQVANAVIQKDPQSIVHIDQSLPFYRELAHKAVQVNARAYQYISEETKQEPRNIELHEAQLERDRQQLNYGFGNPFDDDLPFSKTNTNQIQGYYDAKQDKVVVVASNITEEEAPKVAIHEVAHRGMIRMAKDLGGTKELYQVLTNSEKELMKKLPELLKRTGHTSLENLVKDYGFTLESKDGKAKLLMELAARWAETLVDKPKPSWWKQFLTGIQQWIAQFTGKTLNEQEVNELVGGFVKYGTKITDDMLDDLIIKESPIRSTYPYEAQEYAEDISLEVKKELNKLEFKELNCNL
tara:strand:- start:224 stop:2854 length:2631 start_codon:yes stop_codon:yes gene_type:complete